MSLKENDNFAEHQQERLDEIQENTDSLEEKLDQIDDVMSAEESEFLSTLSNEPNQ